MSQHQFSKFNNFFWVCWFLGKNLSNFVPPVWKLHYRYCHNPQWTQWCNIIQQKRNLFWSSKLLWLQIVPNIEPVDNYCIVDAFGHIFCEIICFELWQNWVLTPQLRILCNNQFQKKNHRTITGGPWWTQIKVVLIQKGLLDHQNPDFCMGWPGLYLLNNFDQLGSLCFPLALCRYWDGKQKWPFSKFIHPVQWLCNTWMVPYLEYTFWTEISGNCEVFIKNWLKGL